MEKLIRHLTILLALLLAACPQLYADGRLPGCVHADKSRLWRFEGDGLEGFYDKLDSCYLFGSRGVNVWQLGDSHLQAEFFPDRMRHNFVSRRPDIRYVRGILFPYSAAGTNYLGDYRLSLVGKWSFSSLLKPGAESIGISGRTAATSDANASVTVSMNKSGSSEYSFRILHVFGYADRDGFRPVATAGGRRYEGEKTSYGYAIRLDCDAQEAEISFVMPSGCSFVLSGIAPDVEGPAFRYFSSGVNGAEVCQWNRCSRLMQEAACYTPDLVIIGLGTNDAAVRKGTFNSAQYRKEYLQLIASIRRMAPGCALILVPSNDIYLSGVNNRWNRDVERSVYEVAREAGAAVWDWLDVMGGLGSMNSWQKAGLGAKDRIHMTRDGYNVTADLLYGAIMQDYIRTARTAQ